MYFTENFTVFELTSLKTSLDSEVMMIRFQMYPPSAPMIWPVT